MLITCVIFTLYQHLGGKMSRRDIIVISVLVITAFTIVFCFNALSTTSAEKLEGDKIKIVLDAGHGGVDGGVSGVRTKIKESELNLKVVKKLEGYLISAGFEVVLTRNSSAGLYGVATSNRKKKDMQKRKEIIENAKPDLVISVHMNNYSVSSRRGAQVFYNENNVLSKKLADNIQQSFNNMKEAVRKCEALKGDYYIISCTQYPSVIAECGFLSNPSDEALLITEEYQDSIAYSIFKGIIEYFCSESIKFCP